MMALHSMGRKHGDPMVVAGGGDGGTSSSSIALLQERFRQLEKRREEMKLFQAKCYEPSRNLLVHPCKSAVTARSSFQDSLTLGLDLYGKKTEHQPSKTPPFRDFWSMDSVTVSAAPVHDKPDVDTSLHL
ncbi:hypothetical protein L1987_31759 [Smallanthus sonchifolius]|uniref:Uncharacterized protein n=1 Tax=Smallanthus sonchifolius TaxID=185202 RepID=A0ACB9I6B1_9ASTR|nr:hypothetical protein L1987_31759 [Smallanthus sonchifolius]